MAKNLDATFRDNDVEVTVVPNSSLEKRDDLFGLRDVPFHGNGFGTQSSDLGYYFLYSVRAFGVVMIIEAPRLARSRAL